MRQVIAWLLLIVGPALWAPAHALAQVATLDTATNALRLLSPYAVDPAARAAEQPTLQPADSDEQAAGAVYDAWGARRNFWLAASEVFGVNLLVWSFNEYVSGANFSQVSPRSWVDNIRNGFAFDDNTFKTNQFAHPYHGSLYFNSARSNGFDYWASAPFAIAGSFMWECCGETHAMAINDWINTSIGGIALGETFYRVSGTILDNRATGIHRTLREIGAFAVSPVRGFNRMVSGRSGQVYENPTQPEDWRPTTDTNTMAAGVRVLGESSSLADADSVDVHAFFELDFDFGSVFASQRRKPFDFFTLRLEAITGQKTFISRFQIRGNLYSSNLKWGEKTKHVFSVIQNYDYMNNNAYEFGGQSFSAEISSEFSLSPTLALRTLVSLDALLMGAVNSNFSFVADLPDVERLREYDYGPGGGGRLEAELRWKDREVVLVGYRLVYIHTLNGSVVNGSDANHYVHMATIQGRYPIGPKFGIGADWSLHLRDSHYSFTLFEDTTHRNPQLRVYGTWKTH